MIENSSKYWTSIQIELNIQVLESKIAKMTTELQSFKHMREKINTDLGTPIKALGLPERQYQAIKRPGYDTIEQLLVSMEYSKEDCFLGMRNFGQKKY